jgi:hypothetical protein
MSQSETRHLRHSSSSIRDMNMNFTQSTVRFGLHSGDLDDPEYLMTGVPSPREKTHFPTTINLQDEIGDLLADKQMMAKLEEIAMERNLIPISHYTIQQLIEQVGSGSYIHRCLQIGKQNFKKGSGMFEAENKGIDKMFKEYYKKNKDGSLELVNTELLKRQKQVLGYFFKQMGSNLLSGKSVFSISFPVTVFESKSLLERSANSFGYVPQLLNKASESTDTLEQFKASIAAYVSSIVTDISPLKPFNPIIGETFQGIVDNVPIYVEQVSHHPPICCYQMIDTKYKLEGMKECCVSIHANSVKGKYFGVPSITFANTGSRVQCQSPHGVMDGTTVGKRTFSFSGKFYIFDFGNKLYCELEFDNEGSIFKKRKNPKDYFVGNIYKVTDKFLEKLKKKLNTSHELHIKFDEKKHATQKLDTVEGCWLDHLKIGDKTYWAVGNPWPHELQVVDNPLPSDSNFRLDILYLKGGDEVKSQEHKTILEEAQRKDRKLRDQAKSKCKK